MDFVEGESLGRFLASPIEDRTKLIFLDLDVDEAIFDIFYE